TFGQLSGPGHNRCPDVVGPAGQERTRDARGNGEGARRVACAFSVSAPTWSAGDGVAVVGSAFALAHVDGSAAALALGGGHGLAVLRRDSDVGVGGYRQSYDGGCGRGRHDVLTHVDLPDDVFVGVASVLTAFRPER